MPVFTTRSLILSAWANGRERLKQAEIFYCVFEYETTKLNLLPSNLIKDEKSLRNIVEELNELHKKNEPDDPLDKEKW